MSDIEWVGAGLEGLTGTLLRIVDDYRAAVYMILLYYQPIIQRWMKLYAPWTDRTGAARTGLYTDVEHDTVVFTLLISHGANVQYGIFLELRGFEIIGPALDFFFPLIMRDIQAAIGGYTSGVAMGVKRQSGVFRLHGVAST
jgi:hypothetical protein